MIGERGKDKHKTNQNINAHIQRNDVERVKKTKKAKKRNHNKNK